MSSRDEADDDDARMAHALALAARGLYTTSPNPRVGCVIVREGRVIGEGYHELAGGPHAEVVALADARARGEDTRGATLYVTLEPCNHVGRTGACTDALLGSGVTRVVAAMHDPNPLAEGGAKRLRAAGIRVDIGAREDEARALNPGFVSVMTRGLPYIRLKVAASLDGRTAMEGGESRWITGEAARADGHAWRARACAVLTGIGTVLADDPEMTVRAVDTPRQPLRIVVDRHGDTPRDAKVLRGGALIITAGTRNGEWNDDVEHLALPDAQGRVDLVAMMRELARRGLCEIHVEAGARLNGALFEAGLVDEIVAYVAPSLLGDPARGIAQFAESLRPLASRVQLGFDAIDRIGEDLRIRARVNRES
ncbi:MAG TPA: bifunctional diaminohydroxyphosphoribosylaminopyrimidine deaminase/5-amino-6-(5-phosphoribosylamino)uracil reductase RibD [Casimicrobiaceae bacterium]|nr:bifunctional diaminohydroxyphosphoribosylaminopyrimidine deaminase/5-amino-6-(5-phosphoribosylamino)uracil reductase RibD [Casimicrobiaceae bacterium]